MIATITPGPSLIDVIRASGARLHPQVREKLAGFLSAAGVGLAGLTLITLLDGGPALGLLITTVLQVLVEPWLLTQLLSIGL